MESKKERKKRWSSLINEYLSGTKTQRAFCEQHGVSLWVFQYWLRQQRRQRPAVSQPKSSWLPVRIMPSSVSQETGLTLVFPNGLQLKFAHQSTPEALASLSNALQRVPC